MADARIEWRTVARRVTALADHLDAIDYALAPIRNAGASNQERGAFFGPVLSEFGLTATEALAVITAVEEIQAAYAPLATVIAKARTNSPGLD